MKRILSVIIVVILFSCSGGSPSMDFSAELLSKQKAYSKISNIYVNLPIGWFIAEDNECNCTDLWLVKNDYSVSIAFKKINMADSVLCKDEEEIEKITFYSKAFVRARLGKDFKYFHGEETFELNGKIFSAYQYQNEKNQTIRTAVFKHYNMFYECEAVSKKSGATDELYSVQNAVLSTLN